MGRNRIKGWRQREKEREREGEREVGEGLRAREKGSREERAERRDQTQAEGTYCTTVQQEAASAENRLSKDTPTITSTLTSPKVKLFTTLSARWAGDCCKNDIFYNTIARQ